MALPYYCDILSSLPSELKDFVLDGINITTDTTNEYSIKPNNKRKIVQWLVLRLVSKTWKAMIESEEHWQRVCVTEKLHFAHEPIPESWFRLALLCTFGPNEYELCILHEQLNEQGDTEILCKHVPTGLSIVGVIHGIPPPPLYAAALQRYFDGLPSQIRHPSLTRIYSVHLDNTLCKSWLSSVSDYYRVSDLLQQPVMQTAFQNEAVLAYISYLLLEILEFLVKPQLYLNNHSIDWSNLYLSKQGIIFLRALPKLPFRQEWGLKRRRYFSSADYTMPMPIITNQENRILPRASMEPLHHATRERIPQSQPSSRPGTTSNRSKVIG